MAPKKWRVAEEEEKEKPKSELVARVIQSVAWRGAIINSDNSVAELQKIELPKAKKAKKAEKDVELKVVEEEVEEGTKAIVIEFFFRFFCFVFFFFGYFVSVWWEKWNRKLVSWYGFLTVFVWKVRFFTF